jgi:uncharacterized membrane protein YkvA (DUF1232 family)
VRTARSSHECLAVACQSRHGQTLSDESYNGRCNFKTAKESIMQSLFGLMQTIVLCGTVLVVAFVGLLSLPQSKLRAFLLPIVGWCVAILCAIYCISPVDIVPEALLGPFGLVDDLGAVVAGITAVRSAMKASKEE